MSAWDEIDKLKSQLAGDEKEADGVLHSNAKALKAMSADAARTLRAKQRIERGLHPTGLLLHPGISGFPVTCGSCKHLVEKESGSRRTFFKCARMRDTNGPATDIRKKWPGCSQWEVAT